MASDTQSYRIIFQKLEEIAAGERQDVAEIVAEAEEIERLRQIVLELEKPEPQSCTTT